jgi:hypothetical protein
MFTTVSRYRWLSLRNDELNIFDLELFGQSGENVAHPFMTAEEGMYQNFFRSCHHFSISLRDPPAQVTPLPPSLEPLSIKNEEVRKSVESLKINHLNTL